MRRRTPVGLAIWGNSGRSGSRRRKSAASRFEMLESRWLMAADSTAACADSALVSTADWEAEGEGTDPMVRFRLDTVDLNGNAVSAVRAGQQFRLRVFVEDLRPVPQGALPLGVFGAYLDVTFPTSLVSVASGATIQFAETLPSGGSAFVNAKSGTVADGLLDEVGAIQSQAIPRLDSQLLFTITMQANSVGSATFLSDAADNQPFNEILLYDYDFAVPLNRVVFGSSALNIVPENPTADIVGRDRVTGNLLVGESIGSQFISSSWGQWPSVHEWSNVLVGDFDGDGKQDMVGRRNGNWWVSRTNASGTVVTEYWGRWNTANWVDVLVGDFNGDNRDDIVSRAGKFLYVSVSTGSSFSNPRVWGEWSETTIRDNVTVADLDGDGRDELVARIRDTGDWLVGRSWGIPYDAAKRFESGFVSTVWGKWSTSVAWTNISFGDFTGDGKDDIAGRDSSTGNWFVAVSSGTALTTSSTRWGRFGATTTWLDVRVGDVNGDGRDDLIGRVQSNGEWYVARSTTTNTFVNESRGFWPDAAFSDVAFADFTGDGRPDIVGRQANGNWTLSRWTGSTFSAESWGSWTPSDSLGDVVAADLDGDGRADMVGRDMGNWQWARSTGTTFQNSTWHQWPHYIEWQDVMVADINGDGFSDLVGRNDGTWWVARSTTTGFVSEPLAGGRWQVQAVWTDARVGDFNGDGRDDILGRSGKKIYVSLSGPSGLAMSAWGEWSANNTWLNVTVGDFDNDGKDDLLGRVASTGEWYVAESDGTKFSTVPWGKWPLVTPDPFAQVLVGDFNGDGRDDVAGRASTNGDWIVSLSTGSALVLGATRWTRWGTTSTWLDARVGDVNGDGRDDIVGRIAGNGDWYLNLSNGSSFGAAEKKGNWSTLSSWSNVALADVTGDGRADLIGRSATGDWTVSRWNGTAFVNESWGSWPTTSTWQDVLVGNFSNRIPSSLNVAAATPVEPSSATSLTEAELQPIVDAAIAQMVRTSPQQAALLASIQFQIADLPGTLLGQSLGTTVLIDRDAAGFGWFLDSTPDDGSEFAGSDGSGGRLLSPQNTTRKQVDLLSVVLHELGHALGEDHDASGVMQSTLVPGVRYSWEEVSNASPPSTENVDAYFAGLNSSRPSARW